MPRNFNKLRNFRFSHHVDGRGIRLDVGGSFDFVKRLNRSRFVDGNGGDGVVHIYSASSKDGVSAAKFRAAIMSSVYWAKLMAMMAHTHTYKHKRTHPQNMHLPISLMRAHA